jgi:excisionase family DNA binding protein
MSSPAKVSASPAASRGGQRGAPAITLDEARQRATLTVDEAAVLLMVSRSSAHEAARRGQIPSFFIGRRRRVPARALLRMLDAEPDDGSDDA